MTLMGTVITFFTRFGGISYSRDDCKKDLSWCNLVWLVCMKTICRDYDGKLVGICRYRDVPRLVSYHQHGQTEGRKEDYGDHKRKGPYVSM
jgi:hypothetical protein